MIKQVVDVPLREFWLGICGLDTTKVVFGFAKTTQAHKVTEGNISLLDTEEVRIKGST